MREIKFRGLRIDGKGWVYGDLFNTSCSEACNFLPTIIENGGVSRDGFHLVTPESVGQLLHTEKNGREWYEGDIARMDIYVPPTGYHDGNGWLNNDDGFEGYAVGEVTFHIRHGLCLTNYTLTDLDTEEDVQKNIKFKTIVLSRTKIIGNIHETP